MIGGGNVAMDVARELMRNADDLKERTDIPDNVYEGIKANKAKTLHLFIRRGVAQASSPCRSCAKWRSCRACS